MPRGGHSETEASIRSKSRQLPSDLRLAQRRFNKFGKKAKRDLKKSFSGVRRDMVGALGIGVGTAAFVQAGRKVHDFNKQLLDVRVQAGLSGKAARNLAKSIDEISIKTGLARQEILAGTEALINRLGPTAANAKAIEALAKVSVAAATPMTDLVGVQQLLVKNLGVMEHEIVATFSSLINVGKEASVPLAEMSTNLVNTSAAMVDLGLKGRAGAATLGAAFQAMQPFLGTAAETATGVNAAVKGLTENAEKLSKLGIQVFETEAGIQVRDPVALAQELKGALAGISITKFKKLFPGIREQRGVKALIAGADQFQRLRDNALTATDAIDDFATKISSEVGRINVALAKMNVKISSIFTEDRIKRFVNAVELGAGAVKQLADNLLAVAAVLTVIKYRTALISGLGVAGTFAGTAGAGAVGVGRAVGFARTGASLGQLAVSAAAAAAGLTAAGVAGVGLGRFLDEEFGISDWLANVNTTKKLQRIAPTGGEVAGGFTSGGRATPRGVLSQASERGFLTAAGEIDFIAIARAAGTNSDAIVRAIEKAQSATSVKITVGVEKGATIAEIEEAARAGAQ